MDRMDKIIGDVAYVLDSLRNLRNIYQTGNCNTCDNKECQHKPKVGQMVRYNCYDYKGIYKELNK